MKKIKICLYMLCCLCGFVHGQTGISAKSIIQSPYYDALALYYALQGYNAYPIPTGTRSDIQDTQVTGSQETEGQSGSPTPTTDQVGGQNNGLLVDANASPPPPPVKYTIIESSSGKILMDDYTGDIRMVLCEHSFEPGEQIKLINEILSRNAHLTGATSAEIQTAYKNNSFLQPYFSFFNDTGFAVTPNNLTGKLKFDNVFQPVGISKLGGGTLSLSGRIINGYTDYLITAVNAEIDDAFFIQLSKALNHYQELGLLFPNVLSEITKIEVTNFKQSLNTLRSAYQTDVRNILSNVSKLATLDKYRNLINVHPALTILFVACDIVYLIKQGDIPADILYKIRQADYIDSVQTNNYNSAVKLAALISYCLRDIRLGDLNTDKIGWINQQKLNAFSSETAFFQIFMGLMAQQADGIQFDTFNFKGELYASRDEIIRTKFIVYNFIGSTRKLYDYINKASLALQKSQPTTISPYGTFYIDVASQILGYASNCLTILPSTKTRDARVEIQKIQDRYVPILKQANTVLAKIESQDYDMAIYETDTLLKQIFVISDHKNLDNAIAKVQVDIQIAPDTTTKAYLTRKLDTLNLQLTAIKNSADSFPAFRNYFLKYGLFIASVAAAKDEEGVKTAISTFALPKGSSRIKKEHDWSIGLNAYVGFYHAWNYFYSSVKLPSQENGFTAPLGIAVNRGLGKRGSISAYIGVIDVGAIFSYKVSSDSTVSSDIQFGQILSPSIGLIYGLPIFRKFNIPLSIGGNLQWGPTLQKVSEAGNSSLPFLTMRWNVFIALDLPIVNFAVSNH